jgi:hypothetical protein
MPEEFNYIFIALDWATSVNASQKYEARVYSFSHSVTVLAARLLTSEIPGLSLYMYELAFTVAPTN